ncbi:MAG: YrzE family protein [Actinomycetota bacterium]
MQATIIDIDRRPGPLVRWGAIVAGAVWGLAVMAVLASLWLAVAFPSDNAFVRGNLEWFLAGSGAFSLFVAGLVAGMLTDNRGPGSGWLHGMTAWGVLLIATIVFGLPSVFGLFSVGQLRAIGGGNLVEPGTNDVLWATFLTLVIGAVAAALGGLIGGTPRRSVGTSGRGANRHEPDDLDAVAAPRRREPTASGDTTRLERASDESERVLVQRADDGAYVDQDGQRYVPEDSSIASDRGDTY